mgnify:FL=1
MGDASAASGGITQVVKIVTLGDLGTGKTTLCQAMCGRPNEAATAPTLGIDFWSKLVHHNHDRIRINAYDTSGQERFQALTPSYLRTADVVLVVLEATMGDDDMAECLKRWHNVARGNAPPSVRVVVAITKRDLVDGTVIVGPAVGAQLVKCGLKRYHVVTGKDGFSGTGVHGLWDDVVECAIRCCQARQAPVGRAALGVRVGGTGSTVQHRDGVRSCPDKFMGWCWRG